MQAYHQYGVGSRRLCKLQKIGALDSQPQVYQLFVHDRWFSPGTPVSSTTKAGLFLLPIVLSVLRFTVSRYSFGIFKLFFYLLPYEVKHSCIMTTE
jgi:hypothetical protein